MKTTKTLSAAAALGVAAALAGAPAALADGASQVPRIPIPDIPFPADKIEHRVVQHCATATGTYVEYSHNGCIVSHEYITNDRDHEVWRDASSGQLVAENATVDSTIFSWTKRSNALTVSRSRRTSSPSNITREAEGAMNRESVARGWYRVDRTEVRRGQQGIVLVETGAGPRDNATSEIFVDPTTYATIERSHHAVLPPNPRGATGELKTTDTLLSVEQLPRNAETEELLRFGDHPGATVREVEGEDATIATAARKVGFKAKMRAKIAKKAKASTRKGRRS